MKIRIRGQSLRLRLGRSEVAALGRGEAVEETIVFGPAGRFGVVLRPSPGGDVFVHAFAGGVLTVRIPTPRLEGWAGGDAVGFSHDLPLGNGRAVRLLVEKDFACVSPTAGEPQDDAFPNPSAAC